MAVYNQRCYRDWTPAGATAQQQLSVVTTVWGVTTSSQSGPHNGFANSSAPPTGAPGYVNNIKQAQQNNYQGGGYRQSVPR